MHIPDGILSPPVVVATGILGAATFGLTLRRLEDRLGDRTPVLMGTMAAFVFAAQMVNFPLYPLPISGHLLGGVLAAVLLGPWAGAGVIGAVLLVQCLLFGDGGLTALGANFLNMGVVGAIGGYAIYAPLRRVIGGRVGILLAAMAAAWFSVILASSAFALELAASGRIAMFPRVLGWMVLVHAAIGLGEALITGLVLRFLLLTRPDLVEPRPEGTGDFGRGWGLVPAGLGIALAVVIFLVPFASQNNDGLEFVLKKLSLEPAKVSVPLQAPVPDYELNQWGLDELGLATIAAGVIGTVLVFLVGLILARPLVRGTTAGGPPGGKGPDLNAA